MLNYTFFGEENFIAYGLWKELIVEPPFVNQTKQNITLTFFVSYDISPLPGVDGILGVARSQYNQDVNFLAQMQLQWGLSIKSTYFDFYHDEFGADQYTAYFHMRTDSYYVGSNQIVAGSANIDQQARQMERTQALQDPIVNPFVEIVFQNLTFDDILVSWYYPPIDSNKVQFNKIQLAMQQPGIHMPLQFYTYLRNVFINNTCDEAPKSRGSWSQDYMWSDYLNLQECQCLGTQFYGMPSLEFMMLDNGQFEKDNQFFYFEPLDYELFPKINQ